MSDDRVRSAGFDAGRTADDLQRSEPTNGSVDICYCDRSDHNKCPGGPLCCCSPDLARELAAKEASVTPPGDPS